jgi:hypothetical protein
MLDFFGGFLFFFVPARGLLSVLPEYVGDGSMKSSCPVGPFGSLPPPLPRPQFFLLHAAVRAHADAGAAPHDLAGAGAGPARAHCHRHRHGRPPPPLLGPSVSKPPQPQLIAHPAHHAEDAHRIDDEEGGAHQSHHRHGHLSVVSDCLVELQICRYNAPLYVGEEEERCREERGEHHDGACRGGPGAYVLVWARLRR